MAARQVGYMRATVAATTAAASGEETGGVVVVTVVAVVTVAGGARALIRRRRSRSYSRQLQLDQHHVIAQSHSQIQRSLAG